MNQNLVMNYNQIDLFSELDIIIATSQLWRYFSESLETVTLTTPQKPRYNLKSKRGFFFSIIWI